MADTKANTQVADEQVSSGADEQNPNPPAPEAPEGEGVNDSSEEPPAGGSEDGEAEREDPPADPEGAEDEDEDDGEDGDEDDSALDHQAALKALSKARKDAAKYRTRARELEGTAKSVKDEHTALLREVVGLSAKLPEELIADLRGETRAELEAHAKRLAKYVIAPTPGGSGRPSGGLDPRDKDGAFDPVAVSRRNRRRY